MSYYCPSCRKVHPNWPDFKFEYPEEYLLLSSQEKELKSFILHDGMKIVHSNNHIHYYTRIHWPQRVKDSKYMWHFIVWVLVKDIKKIDELRRGEIVYLDATLQSDFKWYKDIYRGIPLVIKWNFEAQMPELATIVIQESTIYKDYVYGLPKQLAIEWCHSLVQGSKWKCVNNK